MYICVHANSLFLATSVDSTGRKPMAHSKGLIEEHLMKGTVYRGTISCKVTKKGIWSTGNKQQCRKHYFSKSEGARAGSYSCGRAVAGQEPLVWRKGCGKITAQQWVGWKSVLCPLSNLPLSEFLYVLSTRAKWESESKRAWGRVDRDTEPICRDKWSMTGKQSWKEYLTLDSSSILGIKR